MRLTNSLCAALFVLLPLTAQATTGERPTGERPTAEGETPILDEIRDQDPEKYTLLMKLKKEDPEQFRNTLRDLRRKLRHNNNRRSSPELEANQTQTMALRQEFKTQVEAYKNAKEKKQQEIRAELVTVSGKIFELRQAARRMRLEQARARIEKLEQDLARREKEREKLIDEFVDEAIGERVRGL